MSFLFNICAILQILKYICAIIINLIFQQCSRIFLSFIIYRFLHSKYKHISKINKSDLLTPPPVSTKNNVSNSNMSE